MSNKDISREERISAARNLIRDNPALSKTAINTRLKESLGQGLRYSSILSLKREYFKSSPQSIPTSLLKRDYVESIFGPQRARRFDTYISEKGLTRQQAFVRSAPRADRNTRITEAKNIIHKEPDLTKEGINARLRDIFGVGLRSKDVLKEKRGVFKESPKIMPRHNLNPRYIRSVFGTQPEQRFEKLLQMKIWTPQEALSLSRLPLSRLKYIEDMSKSRDNLISQMKILKKENHWTKAEYNKHLTDAINAEYLERGWLNKKGEVEIFRMLDDFRQSLIDQGINPSPGKKGIFRNPDGTFRFVKIKGDTAGQKRRYRELYPDRIKSQRQAYQARVKARSK